MIKKKECRVLWSTRFTPEQIKEMMKGICGAADDSDSSDNRHVPGIILYPFDVNRVKEPFFDRYNYRCITSEPINISCDENGYVFTMKEYACVVDPVLHPIITIDTSDTEDHVPKIRIFGMFERKQMNLDYLYDGVNYPKDIKIGDEILFSDLRGAQMTARIRLCKPVVKWDELEKDETSSVFSYPFKKSESLDQSFKLLNSWSRTLEYRRLSRLSWEEDKHSEQYQSLNDDVVKYRDLILKELDKIL